ncbi:Spo0E like sporulation regulatory protein [Paenibacillus sp. NFR01]|nr:Spo0E like sporulation regulatory protein [Paenibacillus sp. NFR01]
MTARRKMTYNIFEVWDGLETASIQKGAGMENDNQREKIEQARRELNRLALKYGMQDMRVLNQSVKLDALLNEYKERVDKQNSARHP